MSAPVLVPAFPAVLRAGLPVVIDEHAQHRFWAKVDKDGPTQPHMTTPCWTWMGAITRNTSRADPGYGSFRLHNGSVRAHRVAFALAGHETSGVVRHDCDNPRCVNPVHLRIGTQADNVNDAAERGRARTSDQRGESNGCAKLTTLQVGEAIAASRNGESKASIARRLGVSRSAISLAVLGKRWRTS